MSAIASLGQTILRRLLPVALLCGAGSAAAQPLNAVLPQFDRMWNASLVPTGSRGRGDRPEWSRGSHAKTLGVGSTKTRNPVNPHTVFRLASWVSKTFAAVLAGQAAYAGEINLSAPLSRYLPGFRLK